LESGLDNYLDTYRDGGIYDDPQYGGPYISKGVRFARFAQKYSPKSGKVLCIGCGNGFEVLEYLNQGFDAFGTEMHAIENVRPLKNRIVKALVPNLPFRDKEFDLLHCTEVMEHIPPEMTDAFLKEAFRVSKQQFFSIATEMDTYLTHINLHPPGWWFDKFSEHGVKIVNFQFAPIITNKLGKFVSDIHYPDGVTVICYRPS
jgi:hypothetical protein